MDRDDMVTLPLSLPELEDTYETNLKWGRSSNGEHIWSSGQDQAAVIKRQLLLLLPGCSIFLGPARLIPLPACPSPLSLTHAQ